MIKGFFAEEKKVEATKAQRKKMAVVINGLNVQFVKMTPSMKYVILTWFIENQSDVKWNRQVTL